MRCFRGNPGPNPFRTIRTFNCARRHFLRLQQSSRSRMEKEYTTANHLARKVAEVDFWLSGCSEIRTYDHLGLVEHRVYSSKLSLWCVIFTLSYLINWKWLNTVMAERRLCKYSLWCVINIPLTLTHGGRGTGEGGGRGVHCYFRSDLLLSVAFYFNSPRHHPDKTCLSRNVLKICTTETCS